MSVLAPKLMLFRGEHFSIYLLLYRYSTNKFCMVSWPVTNYKGKGKQVARKNS